MSLKIAYYGNCWMTNLGESFIDIGAMELLKQAVPDSNVIFVTPMSQYYNNEMRVKSGNRFSSREKAMSNAAHLGMYIDIDILVLSGMFASEEFLCLGSASYWIEDFLRLNPHVKVLFMGIGGALYTPREVSVFVDYIEKKLNLIGFISRDHETFNLYKEKVPDCYTGIDCAFFVSDAYDPRGFSKKDYVVSSFNNIGEPAEIKSIGFDVIRPQHMFYHASFDEGIENLFISDAPYDYLSLYANAREIHTDLVHATIVSLAYDKPVKYYHDSKRSSAFETIGALRDSSGYVSVSREVLKSKKSEMIDVVKQLLAS